MRTDASAVRAEHLEEALRVAEERFLATFELAPVGIAHVAPDGRWLRLNRQLCRVLGYDRDELVGTRFQDLTHPEDLAADLDQALRTLAGEQSSYSIEKRYVRKDGSSVWADVRVALVREKASEKPLFFVAVVDDVTEQRRAEAALERQAADLRSLLDRLPDVVARFDREGRHLYVNPAVERATGRAAAEFLGRTNRDLGMPPALVAHWERAHGEVIGSDEPREIDFVFPTPQGERRFWSRLIPEHDLEGRVVGVVSVARDLPHADPPGRKLEVAMRHQGDAWSGDPPVTVPQAGESRFRAIFEQTAVGIAEVALDGRWMRANPRLCEILGYSEAELRERTLQDVAHPDHPGSDAALVERLLGGEIASYTVEKYLLRGTGEPTWVNLTVSAVRDAEGGADHFVAIVEDIRQRREAEAGREHARVQLTEREERLRRISDSGMIGVLYWTLDGEVTEANDYLLEMLGYHRDDLEAGRLNWRWITPPGWEEVDARAVAELRESGRARSFEKEYLHRDGSRVPVLLTAATFLGSQERGVTLVIDLTARKDVERALAESEERFRFLAEMIPHLVWSTRPDGYHDYYNARWFDYTGLRYEDTRGPGWNAVLHPEDRQRAWQHWQDCLASGEPYVIEYRFRRHDGEYRWFLGLALPLRNPAGEIVRWFGTCTDIQQQKDAERSLRESQERLQAALDASATGTFQWDMRTNAFDWDAPLARLLGLPGGRCAHSLESFLERVHPEDRPHVMDAVERSASRGADLHEEFRVVWADGTVRWLLDKGRTHRDGEGRPLYMTGACVDITERKAAEVEREELLARAEAARDQAESANRLKSQFLANMSHEIRTPINAVMGYADLLELGVGERLGPVSLGYVGRIKRSSQHLLSLINDVLDLAKVEAGELQVYSQPVEIHPVVVRAREITEPLVAGHGLVFSDETSCHAGVEVWGDADRIRQILINLVSNAAKFTPAGGRIRLRCRFAERTPPAVHSVWSGQWVGVDVEDTGVGIAPEMHERVFAPFVQAEGGYGDRKGGTGLGLTISRTLARLMTGDLVLRSTPGEGTCFTLWLPMVDGSPVTGVS